MKREVTIWFYKDKDGWVMNHMDLNWDGLDVPHPETEEQKKRWEKLTWSKEYGYLIGKKIITPEEGTITHLKEMSPLSYILEPIVHDAYA